MKSFPKPHVPRYAFVVGACLFSAAAAAQSQTPTPAAIAALPPRAGASAARPAPKEPDLEEQLARELSANAARLSSMEAALSKSADRAEATAWRSFWLALAAIAASLLTQFWPTRHQRAMSREQAGDKVSNAYAEWQLKQLSELYGPLRALLGQSNAMYRQMNAALAKARPELFRLQPQPGADFDDIVFEVLKDGQWTRFRTVRDLGAVYGHGYGVEPYFDDVAAVGARMAKLIEDKAGYARPDAKELVHVMGVYLAHYAVLARLHARAKEGGSS